MPGFVFGRIAHIENISRARGVGAPALDGGTVGTLDAKFARDLFRRRLCPGEAARSNNPARGRIFRWRT